jgi:hypothetical protein
MKTSKNSGGANSKQKIKENKKEKNGKGQEWWDPRCPANGATPRGAPGPCQHTAAGGGQARKTEEK